LACDEILSIGKLKPDTVRWRTNRQTKTWLIGTVIEELTAVVDLRQLVPHRKAV
jgi:purine-binding chemotaxis protein CheW